VVECRPGSIGFLSLQNPPLARRKRRGGELDGATLIDMQHAVNRKKATGQVRIDSRGAWYGLQFIDAKAQLVRGR